MRIDSIDIAKGFTIIIVVMGHVLYTDLYGSDNTGQGNLFQIIYSFHMPLFIFLSEVVFNTDINLNELLSKLYSKFRLIIVPFLIIGSISSRTMGHRLSFLFTDMKRDYWYLFVLFIYYLYGYLFLREGGETDIRQKSFSPLGFDLLV